MKRHRADLVSFGFGLFFLIVAAWWAVSHYLRWRVPVDVPNFGWLLAGALILVGVLGVMASLRRERTDEPVDGPEPAEPAFEDEPTQAR